MSSKAEELVAEFNQIMKMCQEFHQAMGTQDSQMISDFVVAISHRVQDLAQLDQEAGDILHATRYVQIAAEMQRIRRDL